MIWHYCLVLYFQSAVCVCSNGFQRGALIIALLRESQFIFMQFKHHCNRKNIEFPHIRIKVMRGYGIHALCKVVRVFSNYTFADFVSETNVPYFKCTYVTLWFKTCFIDHRHSHSVFLIPLFYVKRRVSFYHPPTWIRLWCVLVN